MPPNIQLTGVDAASTGDFSNASMRISFSVVHLLSAATFSRAAGAIEAANAGKPLEDFWDDLQAQALAVVLTAVAGLEAFANELFVDHAEVFPELRLEVMAKLWELYEQKPILEKYEFALLLRQGKPFDRGAHPYQDVVALIKLRNALTHYKPEWSDQQEEHAKVSSVLQYKASPSPFFPSSESLFPRAWASHGSTQWAVRTVLAFIQAFEQQAGIQSRIQPYVARLDAL